MKIRPLTGQVLVRVLKPDYRTETGLYIPDIAQGASRGEKQQPFKAVVIALGPWKKNKKGYGFLPDFGVGQTVICTPYSGQKLSWDVSGVYQLVRSEDVLAKVELELQC